MWAESRTDLLSGKSMFIDMHDMDSSDESAFALLCTNKHVVDDVRRSALQEWSQKRIIIIPAFRKVGRQHYPFYKRLTCSVRRRGSSTQL